MKDLHYLGKAAPAYVMIYNETGEAWEALTTSESEGASLMDFKGAPQPQKATAQHMFIYDDAITGWRPIVSKDFGGGGGIILAEKEPIPSGVSYLEITGLDLDEVPTFINTSIIRPESGDAIIYSSPRQDSFDQDGFIVDFSATTTKTGYILTYILKWKVK